MGLNIGKIVKGALDIVAPVIASAIPIPGLGGIAKKAVTDILGLGPKASESDINKALEDHPELMAQVKQADMDFKLEMEKLGIDIEKIHQVDRSDARAREIALKDKTPMVFGGLILTGWLAMTAALFVWDIPDKNHDLVVASFGILSSAIVGVISYYFGSSAGSKQKTEMLKKK